jgi:hypothetical protein
MVVQRSLFNVHCLENAEENGPPSCAKAPEGTAGRDPAFRKKVNEHFDPGTCDSAIFVLPHSAFVDPAGSIDQVNLEH